MKRLILSTLLLGSLIVSIQTPSALADSTRAGLFTAKGSRCGVLGVSELGEYLKKGDIECFRNKKKAEKKGFVGADLGVLSKEPKPHVFDFELSGANTVPPATTDKTGSCSGVLNAAQNLLRLVCGHTASTADKAHVHLGFPGTVGPKVCIATSAASPIAFDCPLDASEVDALFAGELYVNIHSLDFTLGELRSQIQ